MVHGHGGGGGGGRFGGGGFGGGVSHSHGGSSGGFSHSSHHHDSSHHFHRPTPPVRIVPILATSRPVYVPVGTDSPTVRRSRNSRYLACSFVLVVVFVLGALAFLAPFDSSRNTWELGLNSSLLLEANSFFTKEIKVKNLGGFEGPILYSFSKKPALSHSIDYSVNYGVVIPVNSHQEWAYWLNKGSKVTLSYAVPQTGLIFAVLEGRENMDYWLENPNNPRAAASWNWMTGSGKFSFTVPADDDYYFAFGNINRLENMEVSLQVDIHSLLYDTTEADSACAVHNEACIAKLPLLWSTYAVLATPAQAEVDVWRFQIEYNARWLVFVFFVGILGAGVSLSYISKYCFYPVRNLGVLEPERSPLIPPLQPETAPSVPPMNSMAKPDGVGDIIKEDSKEMESDGQLCAVCLDAPKDSFLDPCGHRATCYNCGIRVQSGDSPNCPICREHIRTVRKIYDV